MTSINIGFRVGSPLRRRASELPGGPGLVSWLGAALILGTTACGAPGSDEADDAFAGWGTSEEADVASIAEELSANESCDTVSANKTTDGWPADFVTGSSYGTSGCAAAYRQDAKHYFGYDFTSDPREYHWVGYGDPIPSNACGRTRFGMYVWQGGAYVGSKWVWGKTRTAGGITGCYAAMPVTPTFDLEVAAIMPGRISVGQNFRFAMSARLYDKAGDSSSRYVTKPIRSWTTTREDNDLW